jgi:hypothetical protein
MVNPAILGPNKESTTAPTAKPNSFAKNPRRPNIHDYLSSVWKENKSPKSIARGFL